MEGKGPYLNYLPPLSNEEWEKDREAYNFYKPQILPLVQGEKEWKRLYISIYHHRIISFYMCVRTSVCIVLPRSAILINHEDAIILLGDLLLHIQLYYVFYARNRSIEEPDYSSSSNPWIKLALQLSASHTYYAFLMYWV